MRFQGVAAALVAMAATSPGLAADFIGFADGSDNQYDWSGFYVGVLAGVGTGEAVSTTTGVSTSVPLAGAIAGVTVGGNMQSGKIVFGLEGDLAWAGLKGETTCNLNPAYSCHGEISWSGTARVRLGYSLDSTLLYGTAGLAVAGGKATVESTPPGLTGSHDSTSYGWIAGAGAEMAFNANTSVKIEYAYTDYGTVNAPAGTVAAAASSIDTATHSVKAGLNFHF